MKTVISQDGAAIAYEQAGAGPLLILVDGALQYRAFGQGMAQLAELLVPQFTVIRYDRRGRGASSDPQPYAVRREVEDIEALIDAAGGPAFLYGMSSGAALAMEAAIDLHGKVKKLAMYEAPYNSDAAARQAWREYTRRLGELLAANRRGDAVALFMQLVGAPAAAIDAMRGSAEWPLFEAVAPTLAYDHTALLGEEAAVPTERAAQVEVPALVMDGGASFPFMHVTATALAAAMPQGRQYTLGGQTHDVAPQVLASVLRDFLLAA